MHLKCLFLDFNRLVELPKEIFALKNLKKLSVKNNHLKSIPAEIGDFENIIEILFNFNRLEVLPDSIKNLKSKLEILDLSHNPMIADGLVGSMGHLQLASIFLQKFIFQEPWQPANFVAISADAVYKKLKSQQIHWNFEMLKKAKFKPVPKNKLSASSIMSLIDLQLSSKIRNDANLIIFKNYVKKLYLPQFTYKNWEMDIKYVEDAKDLIESIITTLVKPENMNDLEMINSNINALCEGIQHCPDRQMAELKICHNIIVGEINFGSSLIDFILNHIAIQKERILDAIVTPAGKNDNVHALNYWKYILNEELGLNFDFTSYFGTINQDIFFGHKGNVLDAFFKIFTPKLIVESLTIAINNSGPMVCKVLQAIENKEFGDMEIEGMFIYSGQIMDTAFASEITSKFVEFYLIYNDILHNLSKKRKSSEYDEHITKSARIH